MACPRHRRRLIDDLAPGAESEAEQLLLRLLREAGFVGFVPQYPLVLSGRQMRIDVAFPGAQLAIEVDGRAFHSEPRAFQRDRARQNLLQVAGYRPEQTLAAIAAMLE